MIRGIGLDMVEIKRMEHWRTNERLLERFFHPEEIAELRVRGLTAWSLAARFAAKEAFGKALGTGLAGLALRDIAVQTESGGRPALRLHATALRALRHNGTSQAHLSLTHEGAYAAAVVVLEADHAC